LDGLEGRFELGENQCRVLKGGARPLHVFRQQVGIGPRVCGNHVFTGATFHKNQSGAGTHVGGDAGEADVNALGGELVQVAASPVIIPHATQERHGSAGTGRGDRLVGALAALGDHQLFADDGLSRRRQAPHRYRVVEIDATENEDAVGHGHASRGQVLGPQDNTGGPATGWTLTTSMSLDRRWTSSSRSSRSWISTPRVRRAR